MAAFTVLTWSRGWIRNEEDNETIHRREHPRSFAFLQLLQILSVAVLLFVGLNALGGWK